MSKKYLRKNEFRYYENPKYVSKSGRPHTAYISARYNHKYKFNVITHSDSFFKAETKELKENPNRNPDGQLDKRPSRISVPRWDKERYFSEEKLKNWRLGKSDRASIKKWNKKGK